MAATATNGNGASAGNLTLDVTVDEYFRDIGSTGLVAFGGFIEEEFLPELHWPQAARVYREMSDNDPVIGGLLTAADLSMRRADRIIKPADETPQAQEVADLCEQILDDMTDTWADTQSSFMSFLPYGFSCHEVVLKRREGPRAAQPSKYTDGKIGVDHLPIRSQETIKQFVLEDVETPYVVQQAIGHPVVQIPYEKLLHFRTRSLKGNPLGFSILRRCYTSWWRIKVIQWIESVGIERDLAGLPIVKMPSNILIGVDDRSAAIRTQLLNGAKNVRRNEAEALAIASDVEDGHELYSFELLTSGGSRQFDIDAVITRYEQRILMSALADFLMLGHEGVGSLGLNIGTAKIDLFLASIETYGSQIASQMDRLFNLITTINGYPYELSPTFEYGPLNKADLPQIATTLLSLSQAGMPVGGDPILTNYLLDQLGVEHSDEHDAPPMPPPTKPSPPAATDAPAK